ncbi:DNRLRE domain-containing protein [bacterium SCSIO 12741]|nr:DNRLRE domain-containing protein [bacterium SCSIO 12741]
MDGYTFQFPYLKRVTESWEEFGVINANQPNTESSDQIQSISYPVTYTGWTSIDVTDHVEHFVRYPSQHHGWKIQLTNEQPTRAVFFYSSEFKNASRAPKLKVWYHRKGESAYMQSVARGQANGSKTSMIKNGNASSAAALFANAYSTDGSFQINVPVSFSGWVGLTPKNQPGILADAHDFGLVLEADSGDSIWFHYDAQRIALQATPTEAYQLRVEVDNNSIYVKIDDGATQVFSRVAGDQLMGQRIAMIAENADPTSVVQTTWPLPESFKAPILTQMSRANQMGKVEAPELEPGQQVFWNGQFVKQEDLSTINSQLKSRAEQLEVPLWTLGDTLSDSLFNALKAQDLARYVHNSDPIRYTVLDSLDTLYDVTLRLPFEAVLLSNTVSGYTIDNGLLSASSASFLDPVYLLNQYDSRLEETQPELELTIEDKSTEVKFGFDILTQTQQIHPIEPQYGIWVDNQDVYALMNANSIPLGVKVAEGSKLSVGFNNDKEMEVKVNGIKVWSTAMTSLPTLALQKLSLSHGAISGLTTYNSQASSKVSVNPPKVYCAESIGSLTPNVDLADYLLCSHPYVPQPCPTVAQISYQWFDLNGALVSSGFYTPVDMGVYRLEVSVANSPTAPLYTYPPLYVSFGYEVDWYQTNNVARVPNYHSARLNEPNPAPANMTVGHAVASNSIVVNDPIWLSGLYKIHGNLKGGAIGESVTVGFTDGNSSLIAEGMAWSSAFGLPAVTVHAGGTSQSHVFLDPFFEGFFYLERGSSSLTVYSSSLSPAAYSPIATFTSDANIRAKFLSSVNSGATPPASYYTQKGPYVKNCYTNLSCGAPMYYEPSRKADGGFYNTYQNQLYFEHDFDYKDGSINYLVKTDGNETDVTNSTILSTTAGDYGFNVYRLDASQLQEGYYQLVITNEKDEEFTLRFHNKL